MDTERGHLLQQCWSSSFDFLLICFEAANTSAVADRCSSLTLNGQSYGTRVRLISLEPNYTISLWLDFSLWTLPKGETTEQKQSFCLFLLLKHWKHNREVSSFFSPNTIHLSDNVFLLMNAWAAIEYQAMFFGRIPSICCVGKSWAPSETGGSNFWGDLCFSLMSRCDDTLHSLEKSFQKKRPEWLVWQTAPRCLHCKMMKWRKCFPMQNIINVDMNSSDPWFTEEIYRDY